MILGNLLSLISQDKTENAAQCDIIDVTFCSKDVHMYV